MKMGTIGEKHTRSIKRNIIEDKRGKKPKIDMMKSVKWLPIRKIKLEWKY